MMKVTAFIGSARKKHTYNVAKFFLEKLQSHQEIECEIVSLNEYVKCALIGAKTYVL